MDYNKYYYETQAEESRRDTSKKRLAVFGAVTLVICVIAGFVSGAVSSFLVLKYYPLTDRNTGAAEENTFVPEIIEPYTNDEPLPSSEEQTQAPSAVYVPVPATEPDTSAAQKAGMTKGEIYAGAVNSIVSIKCESVQTVQSFFGFFSEQRVTSSGSGFFWTEDGYIVTNHHVVENARSIKVTLYDSSEFSATLVGSDASNDIAVLKAEGSFIPVKVGSSSSLAVGDDILVIGNALGELSYTFTDGVVSYLSRLVSTDSGARINMFQTNAAINEGNSGGPVYDMEGSVVGIASAKYASSSVEGLGFCIPIDDVKDKINDIISFGYVTGRPSIGVSVQSVSVTMAIRYNIPQGCYIVAVGSDTAAQAAGLSSGYVITSADGYTVTSYDELSAVLMNKKAGDTLTLTAVYQGSEQYFTLVLDEKKPAPPRTDYSDVYDI